MQVTQLKNRVSRRKSLPFLTSLAHLEEKFCEELRWFQQELVWGCATAGGIQEVRQLLKEGRGPAHMPAV